MTRHREVIPREGVESMDVVFTNSLAYYLVIVIPREGVESPRSSEGPETIAAHGNPVIPREGVESFLL